MKELILIRLYQSLILLTAPYGLLCTRAILNIYSTHILRAKKHNPAIRSFNLQSFSTLVCLWTYTMY